MLNGKSAQERAQEVADRLVGTCGDPTEEEEELFDDMDFCLEFDSLVARCDTCGWWVESCDLDEPGGSCSDCLSDSQGDD